MEGTFEERFHANRLAKDKNHAVYSVKWELLDPYCKKWSKNRDCDETRVQEMYDFYLNGGYLPLILYLAELPDEKLVCYDGNHRREVISRLLNKKKIKHITCLIDIMFHATETEVYDAFENLNKSVQVPAIYKSECKSEIKIGISDLTRKYVKTYGEFASSSSICQRPNFNRDIFQDDLMDVYRDFEGNITIEEIEDCLDYLNRHYRKSFRKCDETKVFDKCKTGGLWLFFENRHLSIRDIHKAYKVIHQ